MRTSNYSLTLILILCLAFNISYSQTYQTGSIKYEDGTIKNGYVSIPKRVNQQNIYFKPEKNGSEEKISSNSLKSISVQSTDGKEYYFERQYYKMNPAKQNKYRGWLYTVVKGYATLYLISDNYQIDKKGNVYVIDNVAFGKDLPTYDYYLKKEHENAAIMFATTSTSSSMFGLNNILKKNAAKYLAENKELVEKIKNKDYTHRDVEGIISIYNTFMNEKTN